MKWKGNAGPENHKGTLFFVTPQKLSFSRFAEEILMSSRMNSKVNSSENSTSTYIGPKESENGKKGNSSQWEK